MEKLIAHLRKEYKTAMQMDSAAMKATLIAVAKRNGIDSDLIAKEL